MIVSPRTSREIHRTWNTNGETCKNKKKPVLLLLNILTINAIFKRDYNGKKLINKYHQHVLEVKFIVKY